MLEPERGKKEDTGDVLSVTRGEGRSEDGGVKCQSLKGRRVDDPSLTTSRIVICQSWFCRQEGVGGSGGGLQF